MVVSRGAADAGLRGTFLLRGRKSVIRFNRFSFFVLPFLFTGLSRKHQDERSAAAIEVATVRPNKSGEQGASIGPRPGGRLIGTNQTVRNLIRNAFNVQPYQLIGGPDWMDSDRFDIQAKAADTDVDEKGMMPYSQFALRLQSLLEDRFRMVTHWRTREMPVRSRARHVRQTRTEIETANRRIESLAWLCASAPGSAPVNCGTRTNIGAPFEK